MNVRTHFGRSAERFSEGEDDDEDVSLVVRARMSMGNSLASNEDEDEDVNTGVSERGILYSNSRLVLVKIIRRPTMPHGSAGRPHLTA